MKVGGPSKTDASQKSKKSDGPKKTGDDSFGNMISDSDGAGSTSGAAGVAGTAPAAALDALLSVQEAGDSLSEKGRKAARERAENILDALDNIRLGLLTGGIAVKDLHDLATTIARHRETIDDPALKNILDEVELRAHVELAKFGQL